MYGKNQFVCIYKGTDCKKLDISIGLLFDYTDTQIEKCEDNKRISL